ncbi:MAG: glutathione S-transferase family protein [Synechococcales bacterium]|nr:glutathione S-transferase family protein [Synechococcales bacterium]
MLTFYHHPLSPISRRVWIALLEKSIPFEPVVVNLNGDQLKPDFLALNPFHHVPVVVDGNFRVLESLAILDYLEAKYPTPALVPQTPEAIAQMRMVQLVTTNELMPRLPALVLAEASPEADEVTAQQIATGLNFLTEQLGDRAYFGGDGLSLADITAGTAIPLLHRLGTSFAEYPAIATWYERIGARPAWQQTGLDEAAFSAWKRWITLMVKRRQRQLSR